MAYYAKDDQISTSPLAGGIEISEAEYNSLLSAKLEGRKTDVRNGQPWIASPTTMTVYSVDDGSPLAIPDNDDAPEGYVAEPRPSPHHEWDGSSWVRDDAAYLSSIKTAVKAKRNAMTYAATVTISNGAVFKCDKETQDAVVKTFNGMKAAQLATYPDWKAENGYYDLTIAQIQEAGVAIMLKVSQGFSAEKATLDAHSVAPFASIEDAVGYFETAYDGGGAE